MREGLSDASPASAWHWGDYALDPACRRLTWKGEAVEVEDRVFDLLVLLLQHRERPLDRQELCAAIWGKRPVSDATLRQLVYVARRAVGDDGDHQHTISTLYGRGLQWVAPVDMVFETDAAEGSGSGTLVAPEPGREDLPAADAATKLPAPAVQALPPPRRATRWWPAAAVLACLIGGGGAWLGLRALHRAPADAPSPVPRLAIEPITNATGERDLDWVGNGLPGLLGSLLDEAGGLDVVDGKQVAHAWQFKPTQGRTREQQLRFVTGADVLVGGRITKLADKLYELTLHVQAAGGSPADIRVEGDRPGALAAMAVTRVRHRLGLAAEPRSRGKLPLDAFLSEAFARGTDLATHGRDADAQSYFAVCVKGAPDFLPALLALGAAQGAANDVQAGRKNLEDVVALARQQGEVHVEALALQKLGRLARSFDDNASAVGYLQRAALLAQQQGDALVEISARAVLADVLHKLQKPAESRRELQQAEALLARHPRLRSARALLYDIQSSIAGDEGDQQASLAAARATFALRESWGDEQGILTSMFNLALPLRALHRDAESLAVSADCYRRAIVDDALGMQFACGANATASLLDFGLSGPIVAMADQIMPAARRTGVTELPVLALQLHSLGKMQDGDFQAALSDLRKGAALTDVSKLEYATFLDQEIYEALATFAAAPQDMPAFATRFEAWAEGHLNDDGYRQRRALLGALAAAASHRPGEALEDLRIAAAARPLANDGDIEIRMAGLLIAQASHDKAAAAIALKDYDPASTHDAGILRLYAQWATQMGDGADARRAQERLAQLQAKGREALAEAGMGALLSGKG